MESKQAVGGFSCLPKLAAERGILRRKKFSLPVKVYFEADDTGYNEMDQIKKFLVRFGDREISKAQLHPIQNFPFVFDFMLPPSNYDIVVLEVNKGCSNVAARDMTDSSYGLIFFCNDLNETKFKAILEKTEGLEVTYKQKYSVLIVTGGSADDIESPYSATAIYDLQNPYEEQDNPFLRFVGSMIASQERLINGTG